MIWVPTQCMCHCNTSFVAKCQTKVEAIRGHMSRGKRGDWLNFVQAAQSVRAGFRLVFDRTHPLIGVRGCVCR